MIVVRSAFAVMVVASTACCLAAPITTAASSSSPPPPLSVPLSSSASRTSSAASTSFQDSVASAASADTPNPRLLVSTGLVNCGNTCYLSAQLQCAFHIPRVRSVIMEDISRPHKSDDDESQCPASPDSKDQASRSSVPSPSVALQSLRQLFRDMTATASPASGSESASVGPATSPMAFCRALGIPVFEQQDSQEFWKLLLPAINVPMLTDLYQGAFEDYIVALDGSGRERRKEEAFLDLSLDVKSTNEGGNGNDDAYSVTDGLHAIFGRPEKLSAAEGNGWRPERGAGPVDAHKGSQLRAQGLPSILQLHLKRFQYDWNTDTTSKLNDPVDFPLELNLSELCQKDAAATTNGGEDAVLYDLQAVVVHAGEYGSGHYYAYVRPDVTSNRWYRFNDHVVTSVPYSEVYADARGGKRRPSESLADGAGDDNTDSEASGRKGWFGRLWGRVSRAAASSTHDPYGYGGRTSNAYVLQYVKRSDIRLLYDS